MIWSYSDYDEKQWVNKVSHGPLARKRKVTLQQDKRTLWNKILKGHASVL